MKAAQASAALCLHVTRQMTDHDLAGLVVPGEVETEAVPGVPRLRVVLQMAVQDQPAAVPLDREIVPRPALSGGAEAGRILESQFAQFAFVGLAQGLAAVCLDLVVGGAK